MSREPIIVGISASHDASACVLRGGEVLAAIQLERLTRRKHDGRGFLHTREAVDYCLDAAGIHPSEVDLFAWNSQPLAPEYVGLSLPTHDEGFDLFDPLGERSVFVSHHLCHAFAAFFCSPFESAAVLVADGTGGETVGAEDLILSGPELARYIEQPYGRPSFHAQSGYAFTAHGYRLLKRWHARSFNVHAGSASLGELYSAVSQYVFGNWQDTGKLMGLAPYGDPAAFGPKILAHVAGELRFEHGWKQPLRRVLRRGAPLEHRHVAARVQRDLEEALVGLARDVTNAAKDWRLAYAGGIALNSVANQRIRCEANVEELYVMPASHDAGIAIGAAAAARYRVTGSTRAAGVATDFLGHDYPNSACHAAIAEHASVLDDRAMSLDDVAEQLAASRVIGWFEGRSEFGPRALGHRSILASARDRAMWDYVNRRIKFREDFRPFAPIVPLEHASTYFELDEPSPYMLRVVKVRPEHRARLGAVTHVDGTARVQTVDRERLPRLHELLLRYGAKTGVPVLLNTSLNVRGEPIVETPSQALELLLATHLDALVLGDRIVAPRAAATEDLGLDTVLALPPKTRVVQTTTARGREGSIVAEARGELELTLPAWAYEVLARVDGQRAVRTLLEGVLDLGDRAVLDDALRVLRSLSALRLVLCVRSEEPRFSHG
jgi:carbamoyltransferase